MTESKKGCGKHYDYGFRIYNPAIEKFLSVDPLTRSYPELTPYQYASNTPIMAIDIDGLEGAESITAPATSSAKPGMNKVTEKQLKRTLKKQLAK